jgi:hypothetical protein
MKKNVISNPWRVGKCMARVRNLIRQTTFTYRSYKISPYRQRTIPAGSFEMTTVLEWLF